ncbi:MAG: LLM class flavin-dependent oxidoreductase [Rhizobiales bacterium]|nr:LLM class flavin-dependent oxidoreductase [Hyphomicrobiales bacterium]
MDIGVDSFAPLAPLADEAARPRASAERVARLMEEIETADRAGIDVFGVGEHHRPDSVDSATVVLLAAAAARTRDIRLTSAVTVLSADDPVRVFQQYATLDLISKGRAEIQVGRGSFTEAFPLFGHSLENYDELFAEKLDLLLALNESPRVSWQGALRPPLSDQPIFPRPLQAKIPVWLAVGGTPESFVRAGLLGLPLMIAIISGEPRRFRPLVDLYRRAGAQAGHAPETLKVGLHLYSYVAETDARALDEFWPGYQERFAAIGRERGWPPPTRAAYEAQTGEHGAYLMGSPATVVDKIRRIDADLGGLARVTFQMTNALLPHEKMLNALELIGARVKPAVATH